MERTPSGNDGPAAEAGHPLETGSSRDLIYQICNIVAEQTDSNICKLPPLYETIDPDALDAFLRCSDSSDTLPKRSVEFSYCGYRVMADSTGQVKLHPELESTSPIPSNRG